MDYQTDKLASEFIFNNPNIKGTCGCGESFNVWPIYWDSLWYGLWVWIFLSMLNVIICTWVVSLGEESEFSVWIDWWVTGCCKWINVDYDVLWCKWLVFEWGYFFCFEGFLLFLSLCFIQWFLIVCYGENDFK